MMHAWIKKEILEQGRTHKVLVLVLSAVGFGILSPLTAYITPWLFDMLSSQMAESGVVLGSMEVNALTSWMQFFKNIPMFLLIFLLLESNILTNEYHTGTLALLWTKGLKRWVVLLSKFIALFILWSLCYLLIFGISYAYTMALWEPVSISDFGLKIFSVYLFGCLMIGMILFASSFCRNNASVLLLSAVVYVAMMVLSLFEKVQKFLPIQLLHSLDVSNLLSTVFVGFCVLLLLLIMSFLVFSHRHLEG